MFLWFFTHAGICNLLVYLVVQQTHSISTIGVEVYIMKIFGDLTFFYIYKNPLL